MAERKYQMTKIRQGDYVFPSNDAVDLLRVARSENGTWDAFRLMAGLPRSDRSLAEIDWGENWDGWECIAQQCSSRAAAIQDALTH